MSLDPGLIGEIKGFSARSDGKFVVLTGAGISAESGIPTFRGKDGYWTVGSEDYHPQEMATYAMFQRRPKEVWAWYLYRRAICRDAPANKGHLALVALEEKLNDRFLLITQNVDGLHLRAGNSIERTYQIHGNIDYARCDRCGKKFLLADDLLNHPKDEALSDEQEEHLKSECCSTWLRPHVLWFDECYDEENFHFHSSLKAAVSADILLVIGTSGATNLPMQVGMTALSGGATIIDINPEHNPFSDFAERSVKGYFLQGSSSEYLPELVELLG